MMKRAGVAKTIFVGMFCLVGIFPQLAHAVGIQQIDTHFRWAVGQNRWLWALLSCYVAGLLTSLTPCVYPLIPITVGLFGAREQGISRIRALFLGCCYVAGMAVMYTGLGLIVGLTGRQFGAFLSSYYVVVPVCFFFFAMGCSLLGVFSIQLPVHWQRALTKIGGKGVAGAFFMGLVAGIVAAPCTGPVLLSLLTFVAKERSVVKGGMFLFFYSLGLGTLFLFLTVFSLKLPRSGVWMERIKNALGVLLWCVTLYFLKNVVTSLEQYAQPSRWFLIAQLVGVWVGLLLGALHIRFSWKSWTGLRKMGGAFLMAFGLFGAAQWWLLPPVDATARNVSSALTGTWFYHEWAESMAKEQKKPMVVDFFATWCLPCKKMDRDTFSDPRVQKELSRFVLWKVDCSEGCEEIQKRYQMSTALPGLVIVDADGNVAHRVHAEITAEALLLLLEKTK